MESMAPRKPKDSRPTRTRKATGPVTLAEYEKMWEAYKDEQTVSHVARELSRSRQTASRYINDGDPERSLRPLRARWADVQAEVSRKAVLSAAAVERQNREIVNKVIANLVPEDIDVSKVKDLDTLLRLRAFLYGDPDSRPAPQGQPGPDPEKMTPEQLKAYAEGLVGKPEDG